jgi:hypothetical protein
MEQLMVKCSQMKPSQNSTMVGSTSFWEVLFTLNGQQLEMIAYLDPGIHDNSVL